MPQNLPPDPEITAIEAALGALAPARSQLDRDRLMFEAGRRAAQTFALQRWAWPALAASLACLALGEALALAHRPEGNPTVRPIANQNPAPVAPDQVVILIQPPGLPEPARDVGAPSFGGSASGRLRRQWLELGPDALPDPPSLALQADSGASSTSSAPLRPFGRSDIDRLLKPGEPL
jgi:hypothetical protein